MKGSLSISPFPAAHAHTHVAANMNKYKADSRGNNSTDIILHFWQIIEGPANETAQQPHVTC